MYSKIGRITPASVGSNPLRGNQLGGLITESGYQDKTQAGKMFFAYVGVSDVALFSATTAKGMIIYNPVGSGVNLVWNKWSTMVSIVSTAMTGMVLAISPQIITPTGVTAATLTGKTLLTGSTGLVTGQAKAYSLATIITAPVIFYPLFQNAVAIKSLGSDLMTGDLQGSFASAPGTVTVMGAFGAAGVDVDMTLCWEEVPDGL